MKIRVSEIRVKRIRVNQGLGVFHILLFSCNAKEKRSKRIFHKKNLFDETKNASAEMKTNQCEFDFIPSLG